MLLGQRFTFRIKNTPTVRICPFAKTAIASYRHSFDTSVHEDTYISLPTVSAWRGGNPYPASCAANHQWTRKLDDMGELRGRIPH